jgi:hypothetical protein
MLTQTAAASKPHRNAHVGARSICGGEQESDEKREMTPKHALHTKKKKKRKKRKKEKKKKRKKEKKAPESFR